MIALSSSTCKNQPQASAHIHRYNPSSILQGLRTHVCKFGPPDSRLYSSSISSKSITDSPMQSECLPRWSIAWQTLSTMNHHPAISNRIKLCNTQAAAQSLGYRRYYIRESIPMTSIVSQGYPFRVVRRPSAGGKGSSKKGEMWGPRFLYHQQILHTYIHTIHAS